MRRSSRVNQVKRKQLERVTRLIAKAKEDSYARSINENKVLADAIDLLGHEETAKILLSGRTIHRESMCGTLFIVPEGFRLVAK